MSEWVEFTGSDEQIAEIRKLFDSEAQILIKLPDGLESDPFNHRNCNNDFWYALDSHSDITHYWIIPDDPLRDMKIRQAQTGQPVWVKVYTDDMDECRTIIYKVKEIIVTTTPDWNIPGAEYSFTPFNEVK